MESTTSSRIGTTWAVSAFEGVRVVIADTGPINYLILIDQAPLLPALFTEIVIPGAVRAELAHPEAPVPVQRWLAEPPSWLVVQAVSDTVESDLEKLDRGEREAVMLAGALVADLLLMDDRAGVVVARARGFAVTGTLGVIDLAARRGLIDLPETVSRLQSTSFRCRPELWRELLARHSLR